MAENHELENLDIADIQAFEKGLEEVLHAITVCKDEELLKDFFDCLFTKAELIDIGKRWLLVKEIEKGTTQREIAKMFKMSLCKITRGSRELKKEGSAFKRIFDLLNE